MSSLKAECEPISVPFRVPYCAVIFIGLIATVVAGAAFAGAAGICASLATWLDRLNEAKRKSVWGSWDVYINDLHIGVVSDSAYRSLQRRLAKNLRVAASQFVAIVEVTTLSILCLVCFILGLYVVHTLVGWGELLLDMTSDNAGPAGEGVSESLTVLRDDVEQQELWRKATRPPLVFIPALALIVAITVYVLRFRWKDHYVAALELQLRMLCNVSAPSDNYLSGDMYLMRRRQ